eukprot:gene5582-9398_t
MNSEDSDYWWQQYLKNEDELEEDEKDNLFSDYLPETLTEDVQQELEPVQNLKIKINENKNHTEKVQDTSNEILAVTNVEKPTKPPHKKKKSKKSTNSTLYNLNFDQIQYSNEGFENRSQVEQSQQEVNKGPWSQEEFDNFVKGYNTLGKRWKQISTHFVKTRNPVQVTSYGQKYLKEKRKKKK